MPKAIVVQNAARSFLLDAKGHTIPGDAISHALALIKEGRIVAIKGPGGFHLVCDAHNPAAIKLLRERKHRHLKPFPVISQCAIGNSLRSVQGGRTRTSDFA